ncbi:MAG TPA: aminotransferase class V-fold PLP-dependent enzyme [Thermoanaerobaculia bacterium]|jgi:selenocysteine lyase/cysteine desulfurase|nr:aminotransferase class V-fold PLP-dependent enzyme [Thermoanaerobaculia bacterium]
MRELFPVTNHLTYFNHAAVGPLSTRAAGAMERFVRDQRDFGALHWREWYREYDRFRESAARLLNADPGEIAILKNTSEALSFVAQGIRWRTGDNAVTTALEFPPNVSPWRNLESRGVETRVAKEATVEAIAPLVDDRTRVVTLSSVAFHNGFAADLDVLGDFCAERQLLFCVDAIQSLGMLPVDVRRSKISFLCADAHKWLCGPEGATVFFVTRDQIEQLDVIEYGWTNVARRSASFLDASTELVPEAKRFEAGSLNSAGIHGARAAIDLLLEIGIDEIARRVVDVATFLADGFESIGYRVVRPVRSGIVAAAPQTVDGRELLRLHGELEKEGVVCSPREGMLRFSPHFYNTHEEAERVVAVLSRLH